MGKFKKYIIAAITIALFGEFYFYPFQANFRFSAGVLALNLIILLYIDIKEIYLGVFTTLSVLILRGFISSIQSDKLILEILKTDSPAAVYYLLYCILVLLLNVRKNRDNIARNVLTLFTIDMVSNILESVIRNSFNMELFKYIILMAAIRSILSYSIFILLRNKEILLRKREFKKRYVELNTLISSIQAEMFYLNKSTKDIEKVMSQSYNLYENNKDNKLISMPALDIAREIHEIKKDYYRVIKGLEGFMESVGKDKMYLKDITSIIQDNINKYIVQEKSDVSLSFSFDNNYEVNNYYLFFTILNNLITNSIDASTNKGIIQVIQVTENDNILLIVKDAGEGIEEEDIPYIFNPGFTTKFDPNTGLASTGIGLSHIKNIIEDLNGSIDIKSITGKGTTFTISLPLISIIT